MQIPDMCAPAIPLPDAPKHASSKLNWHIHSRYQLKSTYFERAYFREYENANAKLACSCITPPRCSEAWSFVIMTWDMNLRFQLKANVI